MFTRSKDDPKKTTKQTHPSPVPVSKDSGAPSIISTGVEIAGNINSPGEIQLDGSIEGDITCGAFSLGESGAVNGRITAESITIRGRVDGEICGVQVRLEKTAQVTGNVTHQTLSVEGGARVSGQFIHSETPLDSASGKSQSDSAPSSLEAPKAGGTEQQARRPMQGERQKAGASGSTNHGGSDAQNEEGQPQGQRKKASA